MSRKYLVVALGGLVALGAVADDSTLSVATGIDYTSGKYGQAKRTETLYVPVIVKYEAASWTWRLTVPYVETTGPAGVVGGGADRVNTGTTRTGSGKAAGLGDIVLGGAWTAFQAGGTVLDLAAKAKLATGDERIGLSTGQHDYSVQADLYQTVRAHTVFATAGFRRMGDPAGTDFRDPLYASVGWSYRASPEVSAGLSYDYRQRLLASSAPVSESTVFLSWKLDAAWKLQTYAVAGFSRASPDWGGGLLLFYSR